MALLKLDDRLNSIQELNDKADEHKKALKEVELLVINQNDQLKEKFID